MGSQTLEILRQGVWASLTGGWFYDPHQGVFCNVVHLYLWLFLLCSPFVAYLYFPSTWLTWCIYCALTSATILLVKLVNLALHRLYDRAQSMSEANLKNPFFKITKETEPREDETGIEMKVMRNDGSRNSVEQAINEASEENSIMSMENVNSIIDLKVDVHRKNSSESIEMMFYAPSLISGNSQQDQQSLAGSASVTKSIRSSNAITGNNNNNSSLLSDVVSHGAGAKYLSVYPEHESELTKSNANAAGGIAVATSTPTSAAAAATRHAAPHLLRKSSEEFKRRHQRRRLERQSSLDATAESSIGSKLMRNQSDTIAATAARNETFLHPQSMTHTTTGAFSKSASASKVNTNATAAVTTSTTATPNAAQRTATTSQAANGAVTTNMSGSGSGAASNSANAVGTKSSRLQRHRSSETHDERVKQQNRCLFLPIHIEHHHHHHPHVASSGASSSGALAAIGGDSDELELGLGGSVSGVTAHVDNRVRTLQSWLLGSSSDVYIEDDSYTKSDFGIEQLDGRNANRAAFLLQQQQQLNSHYQHQQQYHRAPHHHHYHHHGGANIRKDSNSTMSALQLPIAAPSLNGSTKTGTGSNSGSAGGSGGGMKRRRHSNATALFKSNNASSSATAAANTAAALAAGQQSTVRRIKSTALEINCPRPSVSNLSPHPNSVEAISGQQQIKNPQSALLPPPSKCLVRNPHLNLCPKFGGSFGGGSSGSGGSLNFGASTSGSTTALIESVYPIVEQADEKSDAHSRGRPNGNDLEITDIDLDDDDDEGDEGARGEDANEGAEKMCVDDDEVDDVPLRRRHKALGCQHHSADSDVGDILADDDDDEFKDFDDDLEQGNNSEPKAQPQQPPPPPEFVDEFDHILNGLEQIQNDLKLSCSEYNRKAHVYAADSDDEDCEQQRQQKRSRTADDNEQNTSQALRQRSHSTDSETDNNGSRSPLLSAKIWECSTSPSAQAAEKDMYMEIASIQKHKSAAAGLPQHLYEMRPQHTKGEGDSGCPSSDCEQVSASSKDMLLAGMEASDTSAAFGSRKVKAELKEEQAPKAKDVEEGLDSGRQPSVGAAAASGKSLGAIPKVVKYREVDETHTNGAREATASGSQLHKRRVNNSNNLSSNTSTDLSLAPLTLAPANNNNNNDNNNSHNPSSNSKAPSRTSSSTSSRSISATDIHKMVWLMHGGPVDERGRPLTNMSSAHFQFYQDAIQALNRYRVPSTEGLSPSERIYFRDKMRRNSKQISEPGNSSIGDFSHAHELQSAQLSSASGGPGGRGAHPSIGVVVAPSSLSARNVSNAATLSIQGLINVINDERQLSHARGGAVGSTTASAILNVDGHHIENYCDYWRPACMLSAEKPAAPKSFYKYRFKLLGYEHEFKISMDRLELLALFDRDLHWLHILLSVLLCATVAYLGATILQLGYYKDLCAFLFCAVIASAQYSLVKSVQPDAASPIHGFNKTVAYSRAIYFCLCGGLLLLFERLKSEYEQQQPPPAELVFFGMHYSPLELTTMLLHIMYMFLLFFPVIFSLGLFPQVNTFLMYLLEQIDMHVFGGNAAGSLLGSFLCVLRSILGVMLLYGPLYTALAEGKGTQFIVFSIFCAILVPLGYHLSRAASDFSHLWALIKNCIVSTYRDDDDELSAATVGSAASSQKLATASTPIAKRAKSGADRVVGVAPTASNENIELSSLDKLPAAGTASERDDEHTNLERRNSKSKASSLGSSSQTLGKTLSSSKRAITASNSYASMAGGSGSVAVGGVDGGHDALSQELCNSRTPEVVGVDEALASTPKVAVATAAIAASSDATHKAANEVGVDVATTAVNEQPNDDDEDKLSSSSTTNPGDMSTLTAGGGCVGVDGVVGAAGTGLADNDTDSPDPLPKKLQNTVNVRLKNDLVVTTLLAVVVLGLHCSTVFTVLQPDLNIVLYAFTGALGLLLHYIIPQMRKHMPWLCFARPLLRQKEFGQFEVSHAPQVMWFEKVYIYLCMVERNVLFPLLVISALTADAQLIANKFGIAWGTLIVGVCALKLIRNAYSDPTNQYLIVMFTVLFFRYDFALASETFLIDYFFVSLAFRKCCDFLLKLQFIVTYIAPWQITWGSAFHAFAQPFSVPHSAMLFLQAAVSAVLSTPLNPFLGSAIFLTSYVRPIKFWERDYNTRRIDHSNTRLSSQLERDLGADDNNLNSIFYEHLTRSLQHSLCGDLLMGRWGNVNQGDCFVLASDYLNCLVHIIELGNGLCTFQMRGLEFRGTYCQQREVEAITEDVEDNDGCCCCDPGHLPRMLSVNAMFSTRWLAWQVVAAQYVLEGYSISDNLASATLQVFEYRKVLITYYIKSIIYYVIKNPKLEEWLASSPIQDALQHTLNRQFVDLDPIFNYNLDEDFDFRAVGITRASFCYVYLSWINFCFDKRKESQNPPAPTNSNSATTAPHTPTTNTYNDSKSTPNLSTAATGQTAKSQSQQQLRTRPQKSATMSGSATVNSTEHIGISQSFANISRQASESAPGLSGVGLTLGGCYTASAVHAPIDNSLNSSVAVMAASVPGSKLTPLGQQLRNAGSKATTPNKLLRKEASPTATAAAPTGSNGSAGVGGVSVSGVGSAGATTERAASEETNREQLILKLKVPSIAKDSPIVSLCLALGLLARRSLANASHSSLTGVEFFLHGLHQLFKGDFRIQSPRDEWVFADMELLHSVVAPAVKMALKLQQDHISNPDEFRYPDALYEAIDTCSKDLVISHEADPVWRSAVLRGAPNLLALRHVMEDGSDEYRIIRLTKRFLSFRVIKLNRECVRGLWAGQQQELIYLRNRNPERGSIQNAKQALRNIINSSCDQPIGYPIYVSPLTTSYADTNEQLCKVIGGAITLESIKSNVLDWWLRIRERCRQGCSSGSAMETSNLGVGGLVGAGPVCSAGSESGDIAPVYISAPLYNTLTVSNFFGLRSAGTVPPSIGGSLGAQFGSDVMVPVRRGPIIAVKPALLAGLLNREREQEREHERELRGVGVRKSHTLSRSDRERRVTLPIASTSMSVVSGGSSSGSAAAGMSKMGANAVEGGGAQLEGPVELQASSSPRYTKMSSSSGSLGIGNIITTPGEYPRKSKGPICLTSATAAAAAAAAAASEAARSASADMTGLPPRVPLIDLYKKAIIVDDFEIFDRLDLERRIDVVWPSNEMREKGGRSSWKEWMPCTGMVGHIVHYWIPNHLDRRFRSPFNRILYLIKISDRYVPVSEYGVREYNQIVRGGSDEEDDEMAAAAAILMGIDSRRSSVQQELHELDQLRQQRREGLTPILGSSLESPTSHLVASMSGASGGGAGAEAYADEDDDEVGTASGGVGAKPKIRAVSSSSSEDEAELLGYEMQRRELFLNMWKMMAERKEGASAEAQAPNAETESAKAEAEAVTIEYIAEDEATTTKTSQQRNQPLEEKPVEQLAQGIVEDVLESQLASVEHERTTATAQTVEAQTAAEQQAELTTTAQTANDQSDAAPTVDSETPTLELAASETNRSEMTNKENSNNMSDV